MTVVDMLTILGDRLEDPNGTFFTDTMKYRYLNRAQDKLIHLLNNHLLTDLQVVETDISLTTDSDMESHFTRYITPSSTGDLTSDPFGGALGVIGIRSNNSNYFRKISYEMVQDFTTGLTAFNTTEPVYFIYKNRMYLYNTTANVDVYYIKEPAQMGASTECDLNGVFHDALLELAEAELWRTSNTQDRKSEAEQRAFGMISQYNGYPATGIVGEGHAFDYGSNSAVVDPIYPNYPVN